MTSGRGPNQSPRHADGPRGGPLSCEEALRWIYELLDGELEAPSHEAVAEHFRICRLCYPHLALERSFRDSVKRALVSQTAPAHVRESLLALLEQGLH